MIELNIEERLRLSDLLLSKRRKILKKNGFKETKMSIQLLRLQNKIATYQEG